ncbi:MAG TPA: zinc ribbon domain-containing protein [Gemmatimonadaceae bacterium]|nr:zinc ribbon domain-containing protein [Gemmatimonadaceae bacterium]
MMPLVLGASLAAIALAFVVWPLLSTRGPAQRASAPVRTAAINASSAADVAEAMIARARDAARTCWHCSALCPEPDAAYCSTCGAYLNERCGKCNQPVHEIAAHFCTWCGEELV